MEKISPSVEDIMNDTSHESWCINCGNTQGTNHLGSQSCRVCDKRDWLDANSFRKYRDAQKENRMEIGKK